MITSAQWSSSACWICITHRSTAGRQDSWAHIRQQPDYQEGDTIIAKDHVGIPFVCLYQADSCFQAIARLSCVVIEIE
jgi:hypothetical protein